MQDTELPPARRRSPSRLAAWAPAVVAVAAFAIHAACGARYGVFRDELYFIVCGERLAAGYVDQPPLIAVVARVAHALFGTWVPGLRALAWVASAATAWLAGRLALRLGGGAWSATLAAVAVATSPILMALGHYLTMNAFEPLFCVAMVLLVVRVVQGESPTLLVAAGLLAGIATLNKYSAAIFATCVAAGLLLTRARRVVAAAPRAAALAVALAALVVLPNLLWQAAHGFPFLELVHNGQAVKNAPFSPSAFAVALLTEPNPLAFPLWIGGLVWLLLARSAREHRFAGVAALLWIALLAATRAKPYYVAPVYPLLFAAGAAAAADLARRSRALAAIAPAAVALGGAVGVPLGVPLLSPEGVVSYQRAIGFEPRPLERHAPSPLPQVFADQFGWPELARGVAAAYATLAPDEKPKAVVFGQNYGEAAAVQVYGEALGLDLPPAVSGHNNFWVWGVPPGRGDVLLVISDEHEDCGHGAWARRDLAVKLADDPWTMPYERGRWIWVCRDPARPLGALWPAVRSYQ